MSAMAVDGREKDGVVRMLAASAVSTPRNADITAFSHGAAAVDKYSDRHKNADG